VTVVIPSEARNLALKSRAVRDSSSPAAPRNDSVEGFFSILLGLPAPTAYLLSMSEARKKTAKKFVISGRVQGVGYRYFAERWAEQLGIAGYVKNLWDGTVEVYAIGDAMALEELKLRLTEGPRSARVTGVSESDEAVDKRYIDFMIEDGW